MLSLLFVPVFIHALVSGLFLELARFAVTKAVGDPPAMKKAEVLIDAAIVATRWAYRATSRMRALVSRALRSVPRTLLPQR